MINIYDLHNDFLTEIKSDKQKTKYLKDKKNRDVSTILSAVWTSNLDIEASIGKIEDSLMYIKNRNAEGGNLSLKLAIEDLHFISKVNLEKIINIKPSYCSLTWNNDNILAGGAKEGGDFTNLGIEVVERLEKENIQIDTAHLSERSFMTFSSITQKPIICTHTAVASLRGCERNLKDYQIKMIVDSGGLIGIALVKDFLTEEKRCTISDIARHIDYIVSRFGDKNICLGTDFYGTKNLPKGIKNYNNLILLEERLKFLGYTESMIKNIFYNNAKIFFDSNV